MLTEIARWIIGAAGLWLVVVSVLMLARPKLALSYLALMASTSLINMTELSLRLLWGLAMMRYAERTQFPDVMNVFGIFLVVTSVVLLLLPRRWHAAYAVYWSKKLTPVSVRWCAPVSLLAGLFLIRAVL